MLLHFQIMMFHCVHPNMYNPQCHGGVGSCTPSPNKMKQANKWLSGLHCLQWPELEMLADRNTDDEIASQARLRACSDRNLPN